MDITNIDADRAIRKKELNLKVGQVLLVKNLGRELGKCIIHIRTITKEYAEYRLLYINGSCATAKQTLDTHSIKFYTDMVQVIQDLDVDTKKHKLKTYPLLQAFIADKYPEYFI